ncbi:hypothetical protein [Clostridium sporogenes]|uniref:hypothetical protein n=1 Tax=Clostridium sporogenes TaxID=1509 RepID=UPI001FAD31B7|nr:hypothetical protein [Clostridium sporogenes]
MDIISHNSNTWDRKVEDGSIWSKVVSTEIIEKAKKSEWEISVTAQKNIPKN